MVRQGVGDVAAACAGFAACAWNYVANGTINEILAVIAGALTILVLVQRAALNCRRWHNKASGDE